MSFEFILKSQFEHFSKDATLLLFTALQTKHMLVAF